MLFWRSFTHWIGAVSYTHLDVYKRQVPGGSVIVYTFLATSLGLPLESIAVLIGIDWFAGMFRTLMNVDIDVMIGLLVASKLGELDRDVYDEKKTVTY